MVRGNFPVEQGDIQKRWKVVSRRLKDFHKCIILPIGSLSTGLCRHRAILFKVTLDLAQKIGGMNDLTVLAMEWGS